MKRKPLILILELVVLSLFLFTAMSTGFAADNPTGDINLGTINAPINHVKGATGSLLDHNPGGPRRNALHGTSTNWSGYAVETNLSSPNNNVVSDVKGQWTVPSVTGLSNAYSSTWVGIDGYSDNTVEQIGTEQDWLGGGSVYYAWFEMYPNFPKTIRTVPIRPGDKISAEVKYTGSNYFTLSISNLTTGKSFSTRQKARALRQSAEWIMEAPSSFSGVLPLANFGTQPFTNCNATISGHTGTISDTAWQEDAITMASRTSTKAVPSSLTPDGSGFSVTWFHN